MLVCATYKSFNLVLFNVTCTCRLMFVFHKNGGESFTKAKVKPPRLNGAKVGLFATRSPHRPNPIGLTLAKLDKVEGK